MSVALHQLFQSKYEQLLEISREIKDFISSPKHKKISSTLQDLVDVIKPKNTYQCTDSKSYTRSLKTFFYDNRQLFQTMFELTGKKIKRQNNLNNPNPNLDTQTESDSGIIPTTQLSPYLLFPSFEKQLKLVKSCEGSALKILDMKYSKHNKDENYNCIQDMIKNIGNYRRLNIIIRIILRSILTNIDLSVDFIQKNLNEEIQMQDSINSINAVSTSKIKNSHSDNDESYYSDDEKSDEEESDDDYESDDYESDDDESDNE